VAQTIGYVGPSTQDTVTTSPPFSVGQSFTATITGEVTQIQVRPRAAGTDTLYFFNGAGSGASGSSATAIRTQSVALTDVGANGLQTIVLNQPVPVVAGSQYTFAFNGAISFGAAPNNSYADGNIVFNFNTPVAADLVFSVLQQPPTPIPTLSEWAMILFGVMLAAMAAGHVQRKRQEV
jgi:hypothetical protein